jgi:putative transposase
MMKKLTDAEVAQMLRDYDFGATPTELSRALGVSLPAIAYWLPYVGLNTKWLRYVRSLETRCKWLVVQAKKDRKCLTAATSVIRQYQPSPRRRSIIATALRATFDLDRKNANKTVGLAEVAGESRETNRADDVLISMMRHYLTDNPGQGFHAMFNVLLRDQPGTRYRAMQLYAQDALGMKHRPQARKSSRVVHRPMPVSNTLNAMWSMDFMQDGLTTGERFWILNVIDDCNREAIVMRVMKRRSAKAVVEALQRVVGVARQPSCIRTDNGGEFKSLTYRMWTDRRGISRKCSRPYTPNDNARVEAFNRAVRAEVLNRFEFYSLAEAQRALDDWQLRYNFARPSKPLGYLSPMQYTHLLNSRP